jgi:hypothetical protein
MKVIGLTGPIGCGKDTVARFLCETQGFVQVAFADPLRDGLPHLLNISLYFFSDRKDKEETIPWIGKSPRELMQSCGDWMRSIHPDLLIILANRKIESYKNAPHSRHIYGVVLSDIRTENEAAYVRDMGELWHIYRPGSYSNLSEEAKAHSSENGILVSPHDRVIINGGSIDELYESINRVISNEEQS